MMNRSRIRWIFGGGAVLATVLFAGYGAMDAQTPNTAIAAGARSASAAAPEGTLVTLYKNPTCSCCADWAEHMRANGFRVDVREGGDLTAAKDRLRVPPGLASCHTAEVGGYALEGHVPADVVVRLLDERPEVAGLAVPGMPAGVPGMPGEGFGSYDVLAFEADGATRVYASR